MQSNYFIDVTGKYIFLVNKLTLSILIFAIFLSFIGFSVIYLDLSINVRSAWVQSLLKLCNIYQIDFSRIKNYDAYGSNKLLAKTAKKNIDKFLPPRKLEEISEFFPLIHDRTNRVRILFYELITGKMTSHIEIYNLAIFFRNQGAKCFVWPSDSLLTFIFLNEIMTLYEGVLGVFLVAKGILIGACVILVKLPRKSLSNLGLILFNSKKEKNVTTNFNKVNSDEALVIFFPHKGTSYGKIFIKDQYYDEEEGSPLNPDKILHVELSDVMTGMEGVEIAKSYKNQGIEPYILIISGCKFQDYIAILKSIWNLQLSVIGILVLFIVRVRIARGLAACKQFTSAKIALLGYEYLFPCWIVYSLQANNIRVIASQERLMQAFLPAWCIILDNYFVHGSVVESQIFKNTFSSIGKIHVIGDVRIKNFGISVGKHDYFPRGYKHATLVLDWHSEQDRFHNALHTTNNWANNKLFYQDILNLARHYPENVFVLRGKNTVWREIDEFRNIIGEFQSLSNIVINTNHDEYLLSYKLALAADTIIARYTSLGDQCITIGKPVIYHDGSVNNGYLISSILDFKPYNIIVRNYDELSQLYACALENGQVIKELSRLEFTLTYFSAPTTICEPKKIMLNYLRDFCL